MKVDVTIVEEEDNHLRGFNLPQDSLISDLKVALAKTEGVDDPDNRLRVTFKTDSGDELGLEDEEKIVEVLEQSGQIQANITELDILDGHVRINVEQSIIGDVSLLMGGLKSFEPYLLNHDNFNVEVPNGLAKQMINKVLPFKPCQNKIALVEKENEQDYDAIQYLIENDWNLEVTKCLDPEVAQKTWQLKRKMDDGQVRDLPGKRITYHEKYSKIPKISN